MRYFPLQFNGIAQLDFTTLVADAATEYCAVHVEECGAEDLIAKYVLSLLWHEVTSFILLSYSLYLHL